MHEDAILFSGDAQRAFDAAVEALQPLGFDVIQRSASRLVVSSPGFDSGQNALLGISHAEFSCTGSRLTVQAELGGVDRFKNKMMSLMVGVGIFNALIQIALWVLIEDLHAKAWFLAVPVLTFIPWVFIAPYMARWILRRTKEALQSLLRVMAVGA
jgi:hypothetical protein